MKECNLENKRRVLMVIDDMIAGMISNIKLHPVINELFIRGRLLSVSLVFITQ